MSEAGSEGQNRDPAELADGEEKRDASANEAPRSTASVASSDASPSTAPEVSSVVRLRLDKEYTIGRSRQSTIRIRGDKKISGLHCKVTKGARLTDEGSSHGTLLNGRKVDPLDADGIALQDGDILQVGDTKLMIRFHTAETIRNTPKELKKQQHTNKNSKNATPPSTENTAVKTAAQANFDENRLEGENKGADKKIPTPGLGAVEATNQSGRSAMTDVDGTGDANGSPEVAIEAKEANGEKEGDAGKVSNRAKDANLAKDTNVESGASEAGLEKDNEGGEIMGSSVTKNGKPKDDAKLPEKDASGKGTHNCDKRGNEPDASDKKSEPKDENDTWADDLPDDVPVFGDEEEERRKERWERGGNTTGSFQRAGRKWQRAALAPGQRAPERDRKKMGRVLLHHMGIRRKKEKKPDPSEDGGWD